MNIMEAVTTKVTVKKVSSTKGGEYAGACPGCGGSDRFRLWPEDRGGEGSWWCRGCGKGGDTVQFLVEFCGMSFRDAFKAVGRETPAGYQNARFRAVNGSEGLGFNARQEFTPRHFEEPVETWQLKAEKLVSESHANLLTNDKVLGWLAARGLDLDAVKAFRLGWFPGENDKGCMWRPRTSWGLSEIKKDNGRSKMLWIPRGIIIPWSLDGKIMRIKIRRPGRDLRSDKDVKYCFVTGSSSEPALLNPERKAIVIVESELDGLLVARRAGAVVGCLVLGSATNKPGAVAYGYLKRSLRILDALDSDKPGIVAGKWWKEMFPQVVRWPVPVGKDPGEAFAAGTDILEWILAGLPPALTMKLKETESPVEKNEVTPVPLADMPVEPVGMSGAAGPTSDNVPGDNALPSSNPINSCSPGPDCPPEMDYPPESIWSDTVKPQPMPPPGNGYDYSTTAPLETWRPQAMEQAPGTGPDYPAGLAELRILLNKYPIKIIATDMRTAVITTPEFKHSDVARQVAHLVFADVDVFDFLESHPAGTIHRGNFDFVEPQKQGVSR